MQSHCAASRPSLMGMNAKQNHLPLLVSRILQEACPERDSYPCSLQQGHQASAYLDLQGPQPAPILPLIIRPFHSRQSIVQALPSHLTHHLKLPLFMGLSTNGVKSDSGLLRQTAPSSS